MALRDAALSIHARRYLGSKAALADWIRETVDHYVGSSLRSFCDIFAGTGSVAWAFNQSTTRILANDLLFSNFVCLQAWMASHRVDDTRVRHWIDRLNAIEAVDDNYVSEHFGGRYFSLTNARRIGAIREVIHAADLPSIERTLLLASLLYAADRVANTCGHYDAFRQRVEREESMVLRMPSRIAANNRGNRIFCMDANDLVRKVQADVLYLDPPYNSRQYSDTYHVLENIARWEKPDVVGVARKMDRTAIKSRYCTQHAADAFADLVASARCGWIVVSYNNMGDKGDPRSNACVPDAVLLSSLEARGRVWIEERGFRHFNAGKRSIEDHRERLFVCRVKD